VRAAFVFLTRIPVGGFPYRSEDWAWAAAHAPFVGLVLGGGLGLLDLGLSPLGALPAAFLVLGAQLLLTGAFHEDGLADTCDALGGASDAPRVHAILKDSRIGSFGGAALVFSIGGRAALIAQLGSGAPWALPIVGAAARAAPIWLMAVLPYVTADADAKSRHLLRGGVAQAAVATGWLALVLVAAVGTGHLPAARAVAMTCGLLVVASITGWRYARRVGGITGDFLGATEQLSEVVCLAVLAWKA
jgi:adenosylcobinamide-GDP ribazoletransferase